MWNWRLRDGFLGHFHNVQNEFLSFQSVHSGEGVEGHVDVSSVLCFQSQTHSDENFSSSRKCHEEIANCGVAPDGSDGDSGTFRNWRF